MKLEAVNYFVGKTLLVNMIILNAVLGRIENQPEPWRL